MEPLNKGHFGDTASVLISLSRRFLNIKYYNYDFMTCIIMMSRALRLATSQRLLILMFYDSFNRCFSNSPFLGGSPLLGGSEVSLHVEAFMNLATKIFTRSTAHVHYLPDVSRKIHKNLWFGTRGCMLRMQEASVGNLFDSRYLSLLNAWPCEPHP
jgi:hypothetical protein